MSLEMTRRRFLGLAGASIASKEIEKRLIAEDRTFVSSFSGTSHTLWFDQPAPQWADALPVGNGRLGAMVFGRPNMERIALNEDTLWSGYPRNDGELGDWNNPGAKEPTKRSGRCRVLITRLTSRWAIWRSSSCMARR